MSGELTASLVLKLKDQATKEAARGLQTVERSMKAIEATAKTSSNNALSAYQKLANARETLGIRSEKAIQNEIRQTEAAYQRLASSGQASARELGRAQDAARQKVAELRREMEATSRLGAGLRSIGSGMASGYAGYQAAKFMLADPVRQTMSYDRQLANLSNTAYAGASLDDRRSGMRSLDAAITDAVRKGGGSREGALGTLDKLVASGAYKDVATALKELPLLTKFGTASNADTGQLADIAIRARQTFGITDTGLALDQAMKAGQLGGFELKDMAKWLPQQMAAARQSGMSGESGFRALLAANQAAAITAGSKDEAGNNLVNLLTKINSADAANDAKKLGIDLAGSLTSARAKGTNSLDAFVNLVQTVVGKDARYNELREKAKNETGDKQKATYEAMGDILQGSAIGKMVQDRQALMALVGIMNNRGYMQDVYNQTGNAAGTGQQAFDLIAETPSFKAEQLAAEKAIAMQTALDRVNPLLGGMADGLTSVAREYPMLTAAAVAATAALAALAAAAGAAGLTSVLTGGGGGAGGRALGGMLKGGLGRLAGMGTGALATLGGWLSGAGGAVASAGTAAAGYVAPVAAAGAVGYGAGTLINGGINAVDKKFGTDIGTDIGRLVAFLMAGLGNEDAKRALQIEIDVKGGNIVAAVKEDAARQAGRH